MQSKPRSCDVDGGPPRPPYPPLSRISEEGIRVAIDRWENLLRCSLCSAIQDSWDDLWQHSEHPRTILCRRCLEQENDFESSAGPALPISVMMGLGRTNGTSVSNSFPSVSREEATRGPALLVKHLKELLRRIEGANGQHGPIEAGHEPAAEEDDDWAIVLKASVGEGEKRVKASSSDTSHDVSPEVPRKKYGSLDRTFFVETLPPPRRRTHPSPPEGFCSRNDHGGETYDPGTKRRRRQRSRSTSLLKRGDGCDFNRGAPGSGSMIDGLDPFDFPSDEGKSNDQDTAPQPDSGPDDGDEASPSKENKELESSLHEMNLEHCTSTESAAVRTIFDEKKTGHVNSIAVSLHSPTEKRWNGAVDVLTTNDEWTRNDGKLIGSPCASENIGSSQTSSVKETSDGPTLEPSSTSHRLNVNVKTSAFSRKECGQAFHSNESHGGQMSRSTSAMDPLLPGHRNGTNGRLSFLDDMPRAHTNKRNHQRSKSLTVTIGRQAQSTHPAMSQPGGVHEAQNNKASQDDSQNQPFISGETYLDADVVGPEDNRRGLRRLAFERVNSCEMEASVDSRLLPQTADFTPASADYTVECSIDSRLLPQTAGSSHTAHEYSKFSQSQQSSSIESHLNEKHRGDVGTSHILSQAVGPCREDGTATREMPPLNEVKVDSFAFEGSIDSHLLPQTADFAGAASFRTNTENSVDSQLLPQTANFDVPPSSVHWKNTQESFHDLSSTMIELPRALDTRLVAVPPTIASGIGDVTNGCTTPNNDVLNGNRVCPSSQMERGVLDKSRPLKTPQLREIEEPTGRWVTPTSISLSTRNHHQTKTSCLVVAQLDEYDNRLAGSLAESGTWDIVSSSDLVQRLLSMKGLASYEDVLPISENTMLIVDAGSLSSNAALFAVPGSKVPCLVCVPNFEYLLARTLGWHVLSSDCLGELQTGAGFSAVAADAVWGDFMLYFKALDATKRPGHSSYSWLRRAPWWETSNSSPCDSSVAGRRLLVNFLSKFDVLVPNVRDEQEEDEDILSLASILGNDVATRLKQPDCGEVRFNHAVLRPSRFLSSVQRC